MPQDCLHSFLDCDAPRKLLELVDNPTTAAVIRTRCYKILSHLCVAASPDIAEDTQTAIARFNGHESAMRAITDHRMAAELVMYACTILRCLAANDERRKSLLVLGAIGAIVGAMRSGVGTAAMHTQAVAALVVLLKEADEVFWLCTCRAPPLQGPLCYHSQSSGDGLGPDYHQ